MIIAEAEVSSEHSNRGHERGVGQGRMDTMDSRTGEGSKYVWQADLLGESNLEWPNGQEVEDGGQHSCLQSQLMEMVLCSTNMERAFKRVKCNGGSAGIDGISLNQFKHWYHPRREGLLRRLRKGSYRPAPVRRCYIRKSNGNQRPLGIPVIFDRIVQQSLNDVLNARFNESFSENSHGFRANRNAHGALRKLKTWIGHGHRWAVDIDLKSFFDSVPQHRVLQMLRDRLEGNGIVVRLIKRYLEAGYVENGEWFTSKAGMPQGGPLSPLLSNLILDQLDKELERRGHRFVRYADDFVVLTKSERSAQRVFDSLRGFIENKMGLQVNGDKSQVCQTSELEYLGFAIKCNRIRVSESSLENFRYELKRLSRRNWSVSMSYRYECLRRYVRGWMGYFGISEIYSIWLRIDSWLRCRLRMCYWRQWKKPKRRYLNLCKLDTRARIAGGYAKSSKGYWRIAQTIGHNTGMTNQWLESEGLINIKQLWWDSKSLRITA